MKNKRTPTMMGMEFNKPTQLLQISADNKLPPVDGSELLNLPGGSGDYAPLSLVGVVSENSIDIAALQTSLGDIDSALAAILGV